MPERRLLTSQDMKVWESSQTKANVINFITELAESVKGRENKEYVEPISQGIYSVMKILSVVAEIIEKHPVLMDASTSRFGKVEFRDFYDEIQDRAEDILAQMSPDLSKEQIQELKTYLVISWGNRQRIDYGSGHELNFICFLYGLIQYRILDITNDSTNIVLKVFIEYLRIMRVLETKYWLEPAGSHGVWGLDDYHFLPFLFGAYQLATHKHLKPKSIHNEEVVEMFADRYLYFGCISFINSVKTSASLRWHSPMLDDISGVKRWSKVAEGMIKMYNAEVLDKLPIMQHFYFSEFLRCPEGVSSPRHENDEKDAEDEHVHGTWGDCCGIKLPSAIAATEMNKTKKSHPKPIPFD